MLELKYRFYFYGLHGFFDEIMFTSIHDYFLLHQDISLPGHSSPYSFFTYGLASLIIEWLYLSHLKDKFHITLRSLIYVVFAFSWEYTTGLMLRQFNACPWDYSHKPYNLHGLITLDYAPLWIIACLYQEVLTNFFLKVNIHGDSKMD
eukprot:TCONS_00030132-protein